MNRIHSTLVAVVIGAAATAGLYASVRTAQLGQQTADPAASVRDLASRQAKLGAWGRSLEAALAKRPPALPKLPHFAPVQAPAPVPPAQTGPPVTYVQAPPVVKYEHEPSSAAAAPPTEWSDDGLDDESDDDASGADD